MMDGLDASRERVRRVARRLIDGADEALVIMAVASAAVALRAILCLDGWKARRRMGMEMLDTVVLLADIPEHDLRAGDLGAVVEVYSRGALEVEFVSPTGATRALLTLPATAVRKARATDVA